MLGKYMLLHSSTSIKGFLDKELERWRNRKRRKHKEDSSGENEALGEKTRQVVGGRVHGKCFSMATSQCSF